MSVSRETENLSGYADRLLKWNKAIRLIGGGHDRRAVEREIGDSLLLDDHFNSDRVLDLGSGNGLPALPLAMRRPGRRFVLVESDTRKAAFLDAVRRDLGLGNVTVMRDRIECIAPLGMPEITARAFAPLARMLGLALPHLAEGGRIVLPKGAAVHDELRDAETSHAFDHEIVDLPGARGCVLLLSNIRPR